MRAFFFVFSLSVLGLANPLLASQGNSPAAGQANLTPTEQVGRWFAIAAEAYQRSDTEAWVEATTELHKLRPYNQDFMRHLVEGHASLGQLSQAFEIMLAMQQQGLSVDWDQIEAVEPLREHNLYAHLNGLMRSAGEPFGDIERWATLDSDYAMPEALAFDAASGRLFLGTVHDGLILSSRDGESWEPLLSAADVPELLAVFDLEVDTERGHLWVATGLTGQFQGEAREDGVRSALLRFDLESGELQADYPLDPASGGQVIGSLIVAGNGTVFAADTQAPILYRLTPGASALRPFFGHQNFTSLRGMAMNDDDSLLYLADYELGLFVIDADGGQQAWQLAVPENFNAGGIDGLYWWDNHLVIIQNGMTPQRLVRLKLGDDGLGVTAVAPLAAAHESFDTPTYGVMDGSELYFLSGSHWQYVDASGRPGTELPDIGLMQIDVASAAVRVESQELLERLRRQDRAAGGN